MKNFFKSFRYAVHGIWYGIDGHSNFKVQIGVAGVVIAAGFLFRITPIEWCIILICIGMVLGLEMLNSAIESLVNLVTLERQPLAGRIKDIAAGAVLFVSIISLIVGIIIFRKYVLH